MPPKLRQLRQVVTCEGGLIIILLLIIICIMSAPPGGELRGGPASAGRRPPKRRGWIPRAVKNSNHVAKSKHIQRNEQQTINIHISKHVATPVSTTHARYPASTTRREARKEISAPPCPARERRRARGRGPGGVRRALRKGWWACRGARACGYVRAGLVLFAH